MIAQVNYTIVKHKWFSNSTGSFGLVLQNGNELSTFLGVRGGTETLFSGSVDTNGRLVMEGDGIDIRNFTVTSQKN